jgi:hypothetical protein
MPAEDWEMTSGLREEVTFDIHVATFGFRANYNNGSTMLLILVGTDEENEPFEHICSVGADWVCPDGRHIQHPSGKSKINRSSRYGQWITACMEIPALWQYLQNSAGPTDASIWERMRLHLKAKPVTQKVRGETSTRDVLLPDEFLGFVDINQLQPTVIAQPAQFVPPQFVPPAPTPVNTLITPPVGVQPLLQPVAAPVTTAPVPAVVVGATPEQMLQAAQLAAGVAVAESPLRSQLHGIALASPDHASFVSQAFAIPGVVTDPLLVKELMDPNDFYTKARST